MKVGYLGPPNLTYGYQAAKKFTDGKNHVELVSLSSHPEICEAVAHGRVKVGIVAVENSIDGVVNESIRPIAKLHEDFGLRVCAEIELPIQLFLMRRPDAEGPPKQLVAHEKARGQSSNKMAAFMRTNNMTMAENFTAAKSNGAAAEMAKNDPSVVAIGLADAAEKCGLVFVDPNPVTDSEKNYTRFWALSLSAAKPTKDDKTCFLVSMDQPVPGGITKVLAPFAAEKVNLLIVAPVSIEGRTWEYSFLMEFKDNLENPRTQRALAAARDGGGAMTITCLGSYPIGTVVRR